MTITTDNEIFYAIFGKRIGKYFFGKIDFFHEGVPTKVDFDSKRIIDEIESGKNLLGFYHTHPNMPAYMSQTDYATMKAWVDCEGKELLCLIDGHDKLCAFNCKNHPADDHFVFDEIPSKIYMFDKKYIIGLAG